MLIPWRKGISFFCFLKMFFAKNAQILKMFFAKNAQILKMFFAKSA